MSDTSSLQLLLERMRSNPDVRLVPISKTIVGKLVTYPTLSKWLHDDGFPAVQIGSRWYSENDSITDWICKNCPRLSGYARALSEKGDKEDPPLVIEEPEPAQQTEAESETYSDEHL